RCTVSADRESFLRNVAHELRAQRIDPSVDERIMAAVRDTGPARWPRLLMPRRLTITPLPWSLAAAAALLFAALLGAAVGRDGLAALAGVGKLDTTKHIQFTLVAPDAKK